MRPQAELDDLIAQVDFVEITADLARNAGRCARQVGLRGCDSSCIGFGALAASLS